MSNQNDFTAMLADKKWVEIVEYEPGDSPEFNLPSELLNPAPGTFVAVTDSRTGAPAQSALAVCAHLGTKGVHPILNINCRDYNRIAMKSMVLGAAALGIKAVFFLPGVHQTLGPARESKNVYDLDPIQALAMTTAMKNSENGNGISILAGVQEHPLKGAPELKPFIMKKKIGCGANFIVTDPVTDFAKLDGWRKSVADIEGSADLPVFIGLSKESPDLPESVRTSGLYAGVYRYVS